MIVRIRRGRDSAPVLSCTRADGTSTWAHLHSFFPMHDLTHFALESTLGIANGFFGLLAAGWDIETFAEPGASARMPAEAVWVECAVSALQEETVAGAWASGDAYNARVAAAAEGIGVGHRRAVTADELDRMREAVDVLRRRWTALAPGESIELVFEPGVAVPAID